MLLTLPNELVDWVLSEVRADNHRFDRDGAPQPSADTHNPLVSLCLTSRHFFKFAQSWLFRSGVIRDGKKLEQFCEVLEEDERKRGWVRETALLGVVMREDDGPAPLEEAERALRLCKEVQTVVLQCPRDNKLDLACFNGFTKLRHACFVSVRLKARTLALTDCLANPLDPSDPEAGPEFPWSENLPALRSMTLRHHCLPNLTSPAKAVFCNRLITHPNALIVDMILPLGGALSRAPHTLLGQPTFGRWANSGALASSLVTMLLEPNVQRLSALAQGNELDYLETLILPLWLGPVRLQERSSLRVLMQAWWRR
ncbi:hypothetical protein JCM11641_000234 [Rhodosporidiobolus odoratus]